MLNDQRKLHKIKVAFTEGRFQTYMSDWSLTTFKLLETQSFRESLSLPASFFVYAVFFSGFVGNKLIYINMVGWILR